MPKPSIRNLWFKEWLTPHETHSHKLKKILMKKKTKFQNALVADSHSFGRCLVLDGEMQSAQFDEFIYHESLIHPAFMTHPRPETVVILGGGEGATLREILKYASIQNVKMIDIDKEVVDFCIQHMSEWHQGAFGSRKAEVIIDDARKFIEQSAEKLDLIISDLPSPMEGGPAYQLYTLEFYRTLRTRLKPNGIFAMQAGSGSLLQISLHSKLYQTLKKVFPVVRSYSTYIPSFDVPWAFLVCSQNAATDPLGISAVEIDRRIRERVKGDLKFYDGMTHEGLFRISKNLRSCLEKEKEFITLKKPVYF